MRLSGSPLGSPRWFHIAGLLLLAALAGCAEGARFVRVDEQGGLVVFPLKKDRESVYASPFRAEALKMIEQHCHGAYLITKDGETKSEMRTTGLDADEPLTTKRFWGLQFRCK
ncbi:MAG: hypothetical protein FJ245_09475 [Nitrospira sp.]|nr:hypothetical protein [Nitrospira sp.]